VVHLKGFGLVRVFRTVSQNGDAEYWATNDLKMTEEKREELEKKGWGIHKQCCGVERAQFWVICFASLFQVYRLQTGVSWYEANPPGDHPPLLGSSPLSQLRNS